MRFGLYLPCQVAADESLTGTVRLCLEATRLAREAGFHLVASGQHYLSSPYQMLQPLPLLARVAAEAGEMLVASLVVLVPLHNPVELAEAVVTLDAITGGRFVFGVGLGYRAEEFAAFGVRPGERAARFEEALAVMRRLWAGEEAGFRGRFYRVPGVRPSLRPVRQPHPPIWVAANGDRAVRRAGRLGLPWVINPHASLATIRRQLGLYREALAESGHSPADLPLIREVVVHRRRERAWELAARHLWPKYAVYVDWGQDRALPAGERFEGPLEALARDRFIIGTPEECIREIRRYREELGVNFFIARMHWPGLGADEFLEALATFGREVLPAFRA